MVKLFKFSGKFDESFWFFIIFIFIVSLIFRDNNEGFQNVLIIASFYYILRIQKGNK